MQKRKATKHNDYKRPGASMRRAARCWLVFNAVALNLASAFWAASSSPSLPSEPGVTAPFVKCRIDLKNEKCNSRLDEVRRGIVIASPGVCFELFSPPSGLRRSRKPRETYALLWACQKLFKKLISRDTKRALSLSFSRSQILYYIQPDKGFFIANHISHPPLRVISLVPSIVVACVVILVLVFQIRLTKILGV